VGKVIGNALEKSSGERDGDVGRLDVSGNGVGEAASNSDDRVFHVCRL
jgi:hypothetical protein